MKIVKCIFENTFCFKILYLLFALCTLTPLIGQYTSPYFKIVLVYGFLILCYKAFISKSLWKQKYLFFILLFLGCMFLATIVNFDKSLVANFKTWCYSVIQFLLIAYMQPEKGVEQVKKEIFIINNLSIAAITAVSIISFLLFLFRINGEYTVYVGTEFERTLIYGVGYGNRLTGIISNPNVLGIITMMGIVGCFINIFLYRISLFIKVLYVISLLLNFSCFIMSGSRGAQLGGFAFFVIFLFGYFLHFIKNQNHYILKNIGFLCLSVIIVVTVFSTFEPFKKVIGYLPAQIAIIQEESSYSDVDEDQDEESKKELLDKYYVDLTRQEDTSLGNGRLAVWQGCFKMIPHHFFFGVGENDVAEYVQKYSPNTTLPGLEGGHTHNILIETQVAYGIFSFLSLVLIIWLLIKDFFKKIYLKKDGKIQNYILLFTSCAAVVMMFVNNMTEATILYSTGTINCFFMLYLGYLIYFLQIEESY